MTEYGRSFLADIREATDKLEALVPKGHGSNATSRKPTTKQPPKPKPPRQPRGY